VRVNRPVRTRTYGGAGGGAGDDPDYPISCGAESLCLNNWLSASSDREARTLVGEEEGFELRNRILAKVALVICGFALVAASTGRAIAQEGDNRPTWVAPDRSISFRYPRAWRVTADGPAIHLTSPAADHYRLEVDTIKPYPSGDPTLSPDLRSRADASASKLAGSVTYAGVKPLTMSAGSGAIFRYRDQSASGSDHVAEIWFARAGGHTLALIPESMPGHDNSLELSALFRSAAFAGPGAPAAPSTGRPDPVRRGAAARTNSSAIQTRAKGTATTPAPAANRVIERYEGHLLPSDISFGLKLFAGGLATADWSRATGTALHYAGTYTGTEGNYAIRLALDPPSNVGPTPLTLTMRSIGGMVTAQYSTASGAPRDAQSLKLMEVDAGDLKLRGTSANASRNGQGRAGNASNRRNRGSRGRVRNMSNLRIRR